MPSSPIDPGALHRALVSKLRHHGDVLLATPVLSALKHAAPQCEVDALVYADTAPMLSVPRRKRAWFASLWTNASTLPVIQCLQNG